MLMNIQNLYKKYSKGDYVLNNITLQLEDTGKIYGLIGPNGVGKTTLIRILNTQLLPTSGSIEILGFDLLKQKKEIRKRISVLPQDIMPFLYELTLFDYIYFYLKARGYSRKAAKARTIEMINTCSLQDQKDKAFGKLSGGYVRRGYLALALAADVDIYFLDEPTVGLDPTSRWVIWSILEKTVTEGKTIFLTSHYMEEISKLCNKILVLYKGGKLLYNLSLNELMTKHFPNIEKKIIIPTHQREKMNANNLENIEELVKAYGKYYINIDTLVSFPTDYWKLAHELTNHNVTFEITNVSLEDVAIYLDKGVI